MELTTMLLLAIAIYWLYSFLTKKNRYWEERGVPYVPPVPFLGNMTKPTFRLEHVTDTIREIYNYNKEAKYFGAFNFLSPILVVRDLELIKSITIKNFDNFPDHQNFVDIKIDPLFGGNLFSMAGDTWREARNLLSPAFTSSKMKAMYELMLPCTENMVKYIAKRAKDPKNTIDTKDLFTKYTNDVIASCAFGISIDSLQDPKNDFYRLGREATNFDGILSLKMFLSRAFPNMMKLFRIKIVVDHVANFFKNIVKMTVETRDQKGITRPDMLQLMMDARGKTSPNLKLDVTEMTAQAFVFFFGGFDTTSTQMCILAHELAINPSIQERLQADIDGVLEETKGKPTYDAIHAMPYLDAVFNESMRKHAQANVIDRLCIKAFELPPALPGGKPFLVQPGMNIWVPVCAIHHDENIYPEPDKFDPERYLNKKVTTSQTENLGFGIGPRSCIGNRFAILETKILLFHILAKFTLKANEKTCNPFVYSPASFSIKPKNGFYLTVEPRKKIE